MKKEEFLKNYKIKEEDFNKSRLTIEELLEIEKDYSSKIGLLDDVANSLVRLLMKFKGVHSVRYRIKEPSHLVNKIVRYKLKDEPINVTLENYFEAINDLIGLRVIHLFKSNWLEVHQDIENTWEVVRKEANYRTGDPDEIIKIYEEKGCKLIPRDAGYRSVHYIITTKPTKVTYTAEIQVRTIFEEGWGEIDHKLRYPNDLDDALLNEFLKILNRLAGSADEMGEFVLRLKAEMAVKDQLHLDQTKELEKLKDQINKLKVDQKEKDQITKSFDQIFIDRKNTNSLFDYYGGEAFEKLKAIGTMVDTLKPFNLENDLASKILKEYGSNPLAIKIDSKKSGKGIDKKKDI